MRVGKGYLPNTHSVSALIRRCVDLPATITHVPVAAVLVFNYKKVYLPNTHSVSALIRRCVDLPATITHVPVAAVLFFKYS